MLSPSVEVENGAAIADDNANAEPTNAKPPETKAIFNLFIVVFFAWHYI